MRKHTRATPANPLAGKLERLTVRYEDILIRADDAAKEWVADGWTLILAIPEFQPPYGVTMTFLRRLPPPA
jgi:hypothetical protein